MDWSTIANSLYASWQPKKALLAQDSTMTSPISFSFVQPPSLTPAKAIDSTQALPLVANLDADKDMGLGVEKTTKAPIVTSPVENATPKTITTVTENQSQKTEEKPFVKTGESVSERLDRYYDGKYAKATAEEKEKLFERYVTGHFQTLKGSTVEEKNKLQLADYKKLLSNTEDSADFEMMAKKIYVLENPNQIPAAKAATTEARTPELKKAGEIGVAKSAHLFAVENQKAVIDIIVKSENKEAQIIGAGHASEFAVENQQYVHGAYFDLKNEEIQKVLTSQLGQFDESVQLAIYEKTMSSEFQSVLNLAAENISKMHEDNQPAATQMTIKAGNEEAIKSIGKTSPAEKSDEDKASNSSTSGYVASSISTSALNLNYSYSLTSNTCEEEIEVQKTSEILASLQGKSASEKIKILTTLKGSGSAELMKDFVKTASNADILELLELMPEDKLFSFMMTCLSSSPSCEIISMISKLAIRLSPQDRKIVLERLGEDFESDAQASKISLLNGSSQISLMGRLTARELSEIDKTDLSSRAAETFYENLMNGD